MKDDVFSGEFEVSGTDYEVERNKPMPNKLHGILQAELGYILRSLFGERYDFPTEVSLATEPSSTPDICVYPRAEHFDWTKMQAKETEMPITTIEILSPSQSLETMALKIRKQYFPNGIKSAWIVVPAFKAIHVLLPNENLYFSSGLLNDPASGIEIPVEKVFERVV